MRNFSYETQGTKTYLVYEISSEDTVDSMTLGMLTNNKIPGLAQTFFTQIDDKRLIKYNVSSHINVAQFFTGAVNKKRLIGVFSGIVEAMLSAEDYMIDINNIILDLEHIYADVSSCDSVLICIPIENPTLCNPDLGSFFKKIMFSTQFDQTENCDHVAKIINYLNSSIVFSLENFKSLLDEIKSEDGKQPIVVKTKIEPKDESPTVQQVQTTIPQINSTPKQLDPQNTGSIKSSNVPVANVPTRTVQKTPQSTVPEKAVEDKGMSWFYLMQHYNKENAAAYKAQKEARKRSTAGSKSKTVVQQPSVQNKPQVTAQTAPSIGFAVPGQAAPVAQPSSQSSVRQAEPVQKAGFHSNVGQPQANNVSAYVPRQVPQGETANFGETTVLGGGAIGETTVLSAANNPNKIIAPHLIRKKNNEKISLNKPVFRVGKERSYVDYFIGDNTAISRSHANFITREGEYFVVDTNSTNHTFVNGTMIQSNVETAISHGDTIRLANEDFEFKLY